jgi:hypothetical protein
MAQNGRALSAGSSCLNPGNSLIPGNLCGSRMDSLGLGLDDLRLGFQSFQGAPIGLQKGKHLC